jgi:hypothetical protein
MLPRCILARNGFDWNAFFLGIKASAGVSKPPQL